MSDLTAEGSVVHEEDVEVTSIVNYEFLEAVRQEELGGVVRSVSNFRHFLVTSESSSHPVIDTWVTFKLPLGLLQLSANRPP